MPIECLCIIGNMLTTSTALLTPEPLAMAVKGVKAVIEDGVYCYRRSIGGFWEVAKSVGEEVTGALLGLSVSRFSQAPEA